MSSRPLNPEHNSSSSSNRRTRTRTRITRTRTRTGTRTGTGQVWKQINLTWLDRLSAVALSLLVVADLVYRVVAGGVGKRDFLHSPHPARPSNIVGSSVKSSHTRGPLVLPSYLLWLLVSTALLSSDRRRTRTVGTVSVRLVVYAPTRKYRPIRSRVFFLCLSFPKAGQAGLH